MINNLYRKPVILLLSGGLDSVALLHDMLHEGVLVHAAIVNYGQQHYHQEATCARNHCDATGTLYTMLSIPQLAGSALTDGRGSNVVPIRNLILIGLAANLAEKAGAEAVLIAANRDDQAGFPDCTHDFFEATNAALKAAKSTVEVCYPYIGLTKWQIVQRARSRGLDLSNTWSCYIGGIKPCGQCDACKKREIALA